MKLQATRIPPSHIPDGTLYSVADLGGAKFALNTARVDRGSLKLVKNDGKRGDFYRGVWFDNFITAPSGKKAAFLQGQSGQSSRYHLVSLESGDARPLGQELGERYFRWNFTSFSPQERFLAYHYTLRQPAKGYGGLGIYDAESKQSWQTDNALLPVWSKSGQHLVFVRQSYKGSYDGDKYDLGFLSRPFPEIVADHHFFCKDVRTLRNGNGNAQRIRPEQAARLVSPWYHTLVRYSVKEEYGTYQEQDLGLNQVAPNNRGIVLINQHNTLLDYGDHGFPESIHFIWTTQYLDASGRSPLYKPSPPIMPLFWSRDGERVYGTTENSGPFGVEDHRAPLICFWVHTGRFARVTIPETLGTVLTYVED